MHDALLTRIWFSYSIAGVDTSSTTLAYMCWELSRRRDVLVELRRELDEVMPDQRGVPDVAVLNQCEYLNAFVKECTSPSPLPLPTS